MDVVQAAGKPFVFVLNEAPTNSLLTVQAVRTLSKHGPVAAVIKTRQDFRSSMIKGGTVQELYPKGKSTEERSVDLWTEIAGALNKQGIEYEPAA